MLHKRIRNLCNSRLLGMALNSSDSRGRVQGGCGAASDLGVPAGPAAAPCMVPPDSAVATGVPAAPAALPGEQGI